MAPESETASRRVARDLKALAKASKTQMDLANTEL
jgi:hypothetical protein